MTPTRLPLTSTLLARCAAGFASHALADDGLDAAKKKIAGATMTKKKWAGPTASPTTIIKISPGKTIVFVAGDMKNGGIFGVSKGVEYASKAIAGPCG